MPRRKKKVEKPVIPTVMCPVRGHKHKIVLVENPDRPDLIAGYCGDRLVYSARNPNLPDVRGTTTSSFTVPKFDSDQ